MRKKLLHNSKLKGELLGTSGQTTTTIMMIIDLCLRTGSGFVYINIVDNEPLSVEKTKKF